MGSHAGSLQEAHLGCLQNLGECSFCQLRNSFVSPLRGFISWTLFTSTTLMRLVCEARMLACYLITDQLLQGLAQQGSWLSWLHGSAIWSSLSGWAWLALAAKGSPLTYSLKARESCSLIEVASFAYYCVNWLLQFNIWEGSPITLGVLLVEVLHL